MSRLDQGELQKRVVGLACALSPEQKRVFGEFIWEERVAKVDVLEGNNDLQVSFFSDGLNLTQKVMVEDFLEAELRKRYPDLGRLSVYMQRKERPEQDAQAPSGGASSGTGAGAKPAPGLAGTRKPIAGVKRILAVASGKGGVGKSTVSVNLAVALHNQGYKVGILDADIYGPSIPTMLKLQSDPSVNDQNKIIPPEKGGLKVMSFGFFAGEDSAVIWRGPMIMKALQQFFYDVEWGELDFLVIDLPPGTGDAQLTLVQSLPVDGAVVVTTPQNVATLDAVKGVIMFQKTDVPVLGIVENMATYHCPSCGHEEHIFGEGGAKEVAVKYGLEVLGSIPLNPAIREAGDSGIPLTLVDGHPVRVRFSEIAEKVVQKVVRAKSQSSGKDKVSPLISGAHRGETLSP